MVAKNDTPVEYIIISLHFLTSSMNTSAPKPCMARAPELVNSETFSNKSVNVSNVQNLYQIIRSFASNNI